jgi:hypothetical protein
MARVSSNHVLYQRSSSVLGRGKRVECIIIINVNGIERSQYGRTEADSVFRRKGDIYVQWKEKRERRSRTAFSFKVIVAGNRNRFNPAQRYLNKSVNSGELR